MDINQEEIQLDEEFIKLSREIGKKMFKRYREHLTPEEMIAEFDLLPPLEIIQLEQRLAGIPLEQRLAGIPLEQRLAGIPLEQRLAGLSIEQRLAGLSPQDALSLFNPEDIEAYLQNIKREEPS